MNIDRELLESQISALSIILEGLNHDEDKEAVEGVLNLLEAISDTEGNTVLIELN